MAIKAKVKGNASKPPAGTTNEGGEGEGEDEEDDPEEAPVSLKQMNAAISKTLGRFTRKQLPDMLKSALATSFAEMGIAKKPDAEEDDPEEGAEGAQEAQEGATAGSKGPKGTPAAQAPARPTVSDKKLAKVQRELEEMKAQQVANAKKLAAEEQRRVLGEAFTAQGVRKESVAPLIAWMTSDDGGMVRRDAQGKLVFVLREDDDETELPLREGLAAYFKSDEGKNHLAPRNVGGSGFKPGNGAQVQGGQRAGGNTRAQADQELANAVSGLVGNAVVEE